MPIGIIANAIAIIVGGFLGTVIGPRLSESFKANMNAVFGACAMTMGVVTIPFVKNLPAVILAVVAGTVIGLAIHLGDRLQAGGRVMERLISSVIPQKGPKSPDYESTLITAIVLFCASGTGIYGSIVSGMTGDHSILLAKSILDIMTALIFACVLGIITCFIAVPQLIIFLSLFLLAGVIYPFCTEAMILDFKACGGILLLATGFRMMKVKEFPVADMLPAMILAMPLSAMWVTYIVPLVS